MTESEVRGVRGQRGTDGGEGLRRSMACCLPRASALSGLQDKQRTKQPETAAPTEWFGTQTCLGLTPPPTQPSPQGQRDEYKKQNCQQNDHNSTVIQILFGGRIELIYCVKA